jgi:hypothetical protein
MGYAGAYDGSPIALPTRPALRSIRGRSFGFPSHRASPLDWRQLDELDRPRGREPRRDLFADRGEQAPPVDPLPILALDHGDVRFLPFLGKTRLDVHTDEPPPDR